MREKTMPEDATQKQRHSWHAVEADDVMADFQANPDGLNREEARRLHQYCSQKIHRLRNTGTGPV